MALQIGSKVLLGGTACQSATVRRFRLHGKPCWAIVTSASQYGRYPSMVKRLNGYVWDFGYEPIADLLDVLKLDSLGNYFVPDSELHLGNREV